MTQHTPGPWNFAWSRDALEVTAPPDWIVARVADDIGNVHTQADMPEANARLIAAAPDLLEACREASLYFRGTFREVGAQQYLDELLKAAIAKAEGGAS